MHFYLPEWQKSFRFLVKRLKIGSYCALCAHSGCLDRDLCQGCESLLLRTRHTDRAGITSCQCLNCGHTRYLDRHAPPLSSDFPAKVTHWYGSVPVCTQCGGGFGPFIRIVAPYRYAFPLDQLIKRLKYGNDRKLARVLGSLLAASANMDTRLDRPDLLIPMPLSASRLHNRGFNQAADIARWCAAELDIKSNPLAASRVIDTGSMAGLSRVERQLQILGAFRASSKVDGRRVAIVDDVLTTGASARELARELYDTGAESVELWVLARTSSDRLSG